MTRPPGVSLRAGLALCLCLAACAAPAGPTLIRANDPTARPGTPAIRAGEPTARPGTPEPTGTRTREPAVGPGLSPTAPPDPTPLPPRPRVVVISVDGLRPDALALARTPNIQALTQRGAFSLQAQTVFPSATLPAHAAMFTGQPPEITGVDWNDYLPERGVITGTVFLAARAAGRRAVLVAGKEKFAHFDAPGALDAYVFAPGGDQDVADRAVEQIAAGFDLLAVHLPNADYFGHLTGWMSDTYLFQLSRTDDAVGRLLAALPEDAVVILTADHGGLGVSHGRRIPEDMTIPWMIAGPGIRQNLVLTQTISVLDTADTVAYLLSLDWPADTAGRPVLEALAAPVPPALRLLFTGDINPGRCPAQVALQNNDFTLPYQAVAEVLRAADLTVGSLDGALSDLSRPSPCPTTQNLIGPARTVEGLQFAGFDVITVATNHAKDCGALGFGCEARSFLDTLRHLDAGGLRAVGGGATLAEARAPVVVERGGVRFAFLGVTEVGADTWAAEARPGTAPLSGATLEDVLADIRAARALADVVIVLPQWGVEYAETPEPRQREWARRMIEAGATLVVGNHPHMVQPLEPFPGGLAAYALGNFVFDQQPWRARQGAVLEVTFHGPILEAWRLRPVHIYNFYQPRWAEPDEAAQILARMPLLTDPATARPSPR